MPRLKAVCQKLLRFFVEDWILALATVGWLLATWLLLPFLSVPASWRGVLLFIGLAAILAASVVRRPGR